MCGTCAMRDKMVMQRGGCDGDEAPGRCTLEAKGRLMQQAAGHVSGTSTEVVVVCRCFLERYADEPSSSSCNAQSDWQASSATIHVPSLTNNIRRQLTWPRWRLIIRLVRTTTCKAGTHNHLQASVFIEDMCTGQSRSTNIFVGIFDREWNHIPELIDQMQWACSPAPVGRSFKLLSTLPSPD